MTTSSGRQIVLAARPRGKPELTDFRLEETAIPTDPDWNEGGHPIVRVSRPDIGALLRQARRFIVF